MTSTTGRRNSAPGSAPRGFTLIELVLVMLIACVFAAAVTPNLRGFFAGRKSAHAVDQILTLSRYGRGQAARSGSVHRLTVDANRRTFWLSQQDQAGAGFVSLSTEYGQHFALPEGMSVRWESAAGREWIDFFPDGRAETGGTLRLTDAKGQVFEVGCLSETEPLALLRREP